MRIALLLRYGRRERHRQHRIRQPLLNVLSLLFNVSHQVPDAPRLDELRGFLTRGKGLEVDFRAIDLGDFILAQVTNRETDCSVRSASAAIIPRISTARSPNSGGRC
jgi:hypothetical protein